MDNSIAFESLFSNSEKFKTLRQKLLDTIKSSVTGITNFVVNYEDSCLVDSFLELIFKNKDIYNGTLKIDAVELQRGSAGAGYALSYIDQLIYGTFEMEDSGDGLLQPAPKLDARTGERIRKPDGFLNRPDALTGVAENRLLVLRNIDYALDFCQTANGVVDSKALHIFDKFRHADVRLGSRLLIITNEKLKLPFKVRTVELEPVDDHDANHMINGFLKVCGIRKKQITLTKLQREQIARKICGLTYAEAGDVVSESFSDSKENDGNSLNSNKIVKLIRDKVNRNFLQDGNGLSHLVPKPWGDYILPRNSNFTYDVDKILRDFNEVKDINSKILLSTDLLEIETYEKRIKAIRTRMPHVILLYGRGGVGKSAFAPHFAGLLDFDAWNFNVASSHSKWVGEGAERMRTTLDRVFKSSHLVCRIDEYDRAMGSGGKDESAMHSAHRQVESELMNWLQDAQEENVFIKKDIFVIITTNHKDNITGPLLRSGRIDLVIDIDKFDMESMRETFLTAANRMEHRGVSIVGFESNYPKLDEAIRKLDLDKLSNIATDKGFTVRDIDILIVEMAAHDYYANKTGSGLTWSTDNFVKVLENSMGSARDNSTAELSLGDRFINNKPQDNIQLSFDFLKAPLPSDISEIKKVDFFS